jgi:hypothetical protein
LILANVVGASANSRAITAAVPGNEVIRQIDGWVGDVSAA